ncbi:MAG: hydantoinase/oxoprolinase family protein [Gammaproteobacteria bacterium]|nr:hydantoinase/oxoprolinase family protein [Gammaproteobacteria bacterium]
MSAGLVVGVDVGGTFTDVFVHDAVAGSVKTAKVPSTPTDPAVGFVDGVFGAVPDITTVSTILHGTTVATNALLENKGARTGLITTEGFADVLEMRRRDRPTTWGLRGSYTPVVPRHLRLEVGERTLADGTVRVSVNPTEVQAAARKLLDAGCDSVCLFFINGYANPHNEGQAAAALRAVWPNPYVSVATEIVPEIREFERISTAALNATLQPTVAGYLDRLEQTLTARGFAGDLLIVQSNGGVMTVETARELPVRTALSGPAAGVIAAQAIALSAGMPNVVTCDMGGTSFDVSLVAEGQSALAAQTSIGFGRVVRTPMIEITTIGAGGGSIARVDADGILRVGPESAGSDPGPACYGLGNSLPTVTDANLVLGLINADRPIGGALARLDIEAARAALLEHVGNPLQVSAESAADAVLTVANAHMAGAIRLVSIERGHDPTQFAAMPFGGGGALHTGALIQEVGLQAAIVPRYPGITSALGCVVADMRHDRVQTVNAMLEQIDTVDLCQQVSAIAEELQQLINRSPAVFERVDQRVELDMLYAGQTHAVAVDLPAGIARGEPCSVETIREAFYTAYLRTYGRLLENIPLRIMNLRVIVVGRRPAFDLSILGHAGATQTETVEQPAPSGARVIRVGGQQREAPVYQREALLAGHELVGPALVEQPDTTIFIDPGLKGRTDDFGNLIITRAETHA